jgi:hypothetical protein
VDEERVAEALRDLCALVGIPSGVAG